MLRSFILLIFSISIIPFFVGCDEERMSGGGGSIGNGLKTYKSNLYRYYFRYLESLLLQ